MTWELWFLLGIASGVVLTCVGSVSLYALVLHSEKLMVRFGRTFIKQAMNRR